MADHAARDLDPHPIIHRRIEIDGLQLFYREAGSPDAPAVLLLHGFPSSSRMYVPLLRSLSDRYRVIAPDYPGFGHSDAPAPDRFGYTFDSIARTMDLFVASLGIGSYVLFMQDYGGPVGFRMAMRAPGVLRGLIVQNANAYEEGLGPKWAGIARYWEDPGANNEEAEAFLSLEAARRRHVGNSPHPERYDPDTWTDEFARLSRPGQRDIQAALLYDYRTNVAAYPRWQAWLRAHRPPTLILWGRYDPSFLVEGATAYRRDLPDAELHILDAGHFALDEKEQHVCDLVLAFLHRLPRPAPAAVPVPPPSSGDRS